MKMAITCYKNRRKTRKRKARGRKARKEHGAKGNGKRKRGRLTKTWMEEARKASEARWET